VRAITIDQPGEEDVLTLAEVPDAEPGPGEVLIRVTASGVNRADLLQRQGHYPPPPGASPYLGLECSGTVAALGPGFCGDPTGGDPASGDPAGGDPAAGWRVGDPVCALLAGGGYADLVAVPAGQVLPVPAGVSLTDAAALPEVTCTVWSNVFGTARLRPGELLLVHGGSSGIGTMAIQLAVRSGARVAVTAGTAEKLAACSGLGAEVLINYHDQDFVEVVRDATGGRGADVVLDNMGAAYLARNVAALAINGRLVVIGLQGGRTAELDLAQLLRRNASVTATSLRSRPVTEKAAIVADVREQVWPWLASGAVRPVVDRRLPLAEAAQAHRLLERSTHIGKILLTH
jgi:putative PIG3 family NAD(P)H quinone oxidoreductase